MTTTIIRTDDQLRRYENVTHLEHVAEQLEEALDASHKRLLGAFELARILDEKLGRAEIEDGEDRELVERAFSKFKNELADIEVTPIEGAILTAAELVSHLDGVALQLRNTLLVHDET
jgi:hypothetical protein